MLSLPLSFRHSDTETAGSQLRVLSRYVGSTFFLDLDLMSRDVGVNRTSRRHMTVQLTRHWDISQSEAACVLPFPWLHSTAWLRSSGNRGYRLGSVVPAIEDGC